MGIIYENIYCLYIKNVSIGVFLFFEVKVRVERNLGLCILKDSYWYKDKGNYIYFYKVKLLVKIW